MEEEIHHVREGKHGARSAKQAIAIGLSKARRAGVKLPPPRRGQASTRTRKQAARDSARARRRPKTKRTSPKRARASERALKREGRQATSRSGALPTGAPHDQGAQSHPGAEPEARQEPAQALIPARSLEVWLASPPRWCHRGGVWGAAN